MEKKEYLVKVLIVIFMKYIEDPNNPDSGDLLSIYEKTFSIAFHEIISENYDNSMQHLSSYMTQLLVLLNRAFILSEDFRKYVFTSQERSQTNLFLKQWFDKMSFLMLNFARRINQLAIIHILPLLTKETVTFVFPKMANLVFSAVESDIYIKETK